MFARTPSDSTMLDETHPDHPHGPDWPNLEERQEYLEEINAEMSIYLCVLYFMAEIFRGDQEWAEELSEYQVATFIGSLAELCTVQ